MSTWPAEPRSGHPADDAPPAGRGSPLDPAPAGPRVESRERPPAPGQGVPPPPARPQFELRDRPSAALTRRPGAVSLSAVLWTGAGALAAVAAALMLLDLDGLKAAVGAVVEQGFPQVPAATRGRVVGLTAAVLVVGGALGLLQVVVARRLRAGRGATRFALVVLLALSVVEVVLAAGVVDLVARLALLLSIACGLVGAVFMYLPAANLWFAARRP